MSAQKPRLARKAKSKEIPIKKLIEDNKFFRPGALDAIEQELCPQPIQIKKGKKKRGYKGFLHIQLTATYVEASSSREVSSIDPEGMTRGVLNQLKSEMDANKLK